MGVTFCAAKFNTAEFVRDAVMATREATACCDSIKFTWQKWLRGAIAYLLQSKWTRIYEIKDGGEKVKSSPFNQWPSWKASCPCIPNYVDDDEQENGRYIPISWLEQVYLSRQTKWPSYEAGWENWRHQNWEWHTWAKEAASPANKVPRTNDLNVKHTSPSSRTSTMYSDISFPLRINTSSWFRRGPTSLSSEGEPLISSFSSGDVLPEDFSELEASLVGCCSNGTTTMLPFKGECCFKEGEDSESCSSGMDAIVVRH